MADNFEFERYDMADTEWISGSVTITGGNSGWTYPACSTCNSAPCTCNSGVVTSVNVKTLSEGSIEALTEKLSICQVCGAEDCFVLCSVCVEAVKLARNRWLDDFRKEIAAMAD